MSKTGPGGLQRNPKKPSVEKNGMSSKRNIIEKT